MVRNNKFRVYDVVKKQMLTTGFHMLGEWNLMGGWADEHEPGELGWNDYGLREMNNLRISEWTGFQDTKKVDAYEGDFIKVCDKCGGDICEIIFSFGMFKASNGFGTVPLYEVSNCMEVVGNVFETPDLVNFTTKYQHSENYIAEQNENYLKEERENHG